ncbi:uncharacterized protein LOC129951623 [Eupeodes corollae]|uniref:uncharacterized protein LOC129951623 n=1 Tax=Eupeodes corollae TaxID=290404 RepID=UPI00248F975C|nr:uncharacterized protein LOC129951623 [Eupeodes corollae]
MALLSRLPSTPGSPKALLHLQNCISYLWPSLHKSTQIDAIDSFTNELVTKKTKKWESLRENLMKSDGRSSPTPSFGQTVVLAKKGVIQDLESIRSPELGLDIRSLSRAQLDNLLLSTLQIKNKVDFLYLIKQCIAWRLLPSKDVLIECLKYLSTLRKTQQIEDFIEICKLQKNPLLKIYGGLAPFKAMAMWRSGSSEGALRTLEQGYSNCKDDEGRRMIRIAFKTISEETLETKSDAVLVGLTKLAKKIYEEQKDIFGLACVWKACFASEWFSDQKTAANLFEEYEELHGLIGRRSQSLCSSFLRQKNVDAVHRLIELFLQYKQHESCSNCLSLLFNYQYHRNDLRACAEIIKSCSELEMPLNETQNEQFLSLFLNQSAAPKINNTKQSSAANKFQYKF